MRKVFFSTWVLDFKFLRLIGQQKFIEGYTYIFTYIFIYIILHIVLYILFTGTLKQFLQ